MLRQDTSGMTDVKLTKVCSEYAADKIQEDEIRERARRAKRRVVLPEGDDGGLRAPRLQGPRGLIGVHRRSARLVDARGPMALCALPRSLPRSRSRTARSSPAALRSPAPPAAVRRQAQRRG